MDDNDPLKVYVRELDTIQPLTEGEERDLLQQMWGQGAQAEAAERRLIETKLSLVVSIAERHHSAGIDALDLIQKGNEGLLLALRTLPGSSSDSFATHATNCIESAISKAIAESQEG